MFRALLGIALFLGSVLPARGQGVEVRGRFQEDSLKIGERIPFALTATYPRDVNILFPDSTQSFFPFELEDKKYFPTRTANQTSYDSVVYFLTTYEIETAQWLQMPVYIVNPSDCTEVFSVRDTIFLKQMVAVVPDSVRAEDLPLKINTSYLDVSWLLNYPFLLIIGSVLLVAGLGTWIIFGKRIRRYFLIRKLLRNHQTFLERFSNALHVMQAGFTALRAEAALVVWKQYMERLEDRPYTKFTSKEILQFVKDEKLAMALRGIDKVIYGGLPGEIQPAFSELKHFSDEHFTRKIEEVRHG